MKPCDKHGNTTFLIIGVKNDHVYWISLGKKKEEVFIVCNTHGCKWHNQIEKGLEKYFLDFYHSKINLTEIHKNIKEYHKQQSEISKKLADEDDNNFKDFLKYIFILLVVLILAIIFKNIFRL